jgi:Transposase IS66 family
MRAERARLSRHAEVAKAFDYMLTRWPTFTVFLRDGRICLTNNAAERAMRGIALGRKAWLFAGSDRGGERAAVVYSLIATAKLNDVDPRRAAALAPRSPRRGRLMTNARTGAPALTDADADRVNCRGAMSDAAKPLATSRWRQPLRPQGLSASAPWRHGRSGRAVLGTVLLDEPPDLFQSQLQHARVVLDVVHHYPIDQLVDGQPRQHLEFVQDGRCPPPYRTKTFSCSVCGSEAYFCLVEPITEDGMADYRLDEVEKPERHPDAVKRLTEPQRRSISSQGPNCPAASSTDDARISRAGRCGRHGTCLERTRSNNRAAEQLGRDKCVAKQGCSMRQMVRLCACSRSRS